MLTPRSGQIVRLMFASSVVATLLGACADRRIQITSEPPGALVTLNDVEVGRTPTEVDFTYFGVYDVVLTLDGHEPLVTTGEASPPVHEWPGIDLVFLALPFRTTTLIAWHYVLTPSEGAADGLLGRAAELREQAIEPGPDEPQPEPSEPAPPPDQPAEGG